MAHSHAREIIQAYWQAEHDQDLEAVLAHYGEGAEIITPSGRSQGKAEIAAFYRQVFKSHRQVTVTILRTFESETGIVAEYDCELVGLDGSVKIARGCNAFTIEGGRIVSLRCYFDPADF
jgi:limonene-1,2-epoxide hydrolase